MDAPPRRARRVAPRRPPRGVTAPSDSVACASLREIGSSEELFSVGSKKNWKRAFDSRRATRLHRRRGRRAPGLPPASPSRRARRDVGSRPRASPARRAPRRRTAKAAQGCERPDLPERRRLRVRPLEGRHRPLLRVRPHRRPGVAGYRAARDVRVERRDRQAEDRTRGHQRDRRGESRRDRRDDPCARVVRS